MPSGGGGAKPGVRGGGGVEGREGAGEESGGGEEEEMEALRESSFMMITGGWKRGEMYVNIWKRWTWIMRRFGEGGDGGQRNSCRPCESLPS